MIEAYLRRIGVNPESLGPLDADTLRRIVAAHAAAVPFENTRAHHGEPISVDIQDVLERIIDRHGGGVCYELNGGLGHLLTALGAEVRLIAAQVTNGGESPAAVPALPMSHMALIVRVPGEPELLADVGFGGDRILRAAPVDGEEIVTARGTSYVVDLRPRELTDFEGLAWWHSTSPRSRFMRGIIVSSTQDGGIATLSGRDVGALEWRYRESGDAAPRPITAEQAQEIAGSVFGLRTPLPRRVLRYGPATDASSRGR